MSGLPEPIDLRMFDAERLVRDYPAVLRHRNKKAVYAIACPQGASHRGQVIYSRWRAMDLPTSFDTTKAADSVAVQESVYDYSLVSPTLSSIVWHVNFADKNLFFAYGSGLFAQDEIQATEHPVLGSLREALIAEGLHALTVEDGTPTPVLVMGAERRCRVATDPNAAEGRPHGLYGNAFALADLEAVERATTRIDPPTISNLIAIAAPSGGYGLYQTEQIEHILTTAYSGFRAAVLESSRHRASASCVIHTGFWGCGAFGGHRVLMAMLQILAAGMAGIKSLVFHTVTPAGTKFLERAEALIRERLATVANTPDIIDRIAAMGFKWGVSDGN